MTSLQLNRVSWSLGVVAALAQAGCGKPQNVAVDSGKPASATNNDDAFQNSNYNQTQNPIGPNAKLLDATFDINVEALGLPICRGDVDMQINAAMNKENSASLFQIPRGLVKCTLMGQIDLAQVLGGFAKPENEVRDPMVVENDVIHLRQIGLGEYRPPRPMMPSFLASSKEDLANLDYSREVSVRAADGKTALGNVRVHTISFGDSFAAPKMGRTFKNVLHFEVVNQGFNGVDKVSNLLFDRMEFRISLDPIAILEVVFEGKVADYLNAAQNNPGIAGGGGGGLSGGGLGGGALGSILGGSGAGGPGILGFVVKGLAKVVQVKMKMSLVNQDGLDNFDENDEGDEEVIGGEAVEGE